MPKSAGMTTEECVLFAMALDLEEDVKQLPFLRIDLIEIGVEVRSSLMGDVVRILVVTSTEQSADNETLWLLMH